MKIPMIIHSPEPNVVRGDSLCYRLGTGVCYEEQETVRTSSALPVPLSASSSDQNGFGYEHRFDRQQLCS